MGTSYTYKCDHCGYKVYSNGPWEFYRDKNGVIKPYGHPVPMSKEAAKCGITGLTYNLYCPKCDKTSEVITVEFKKSTKESLDVWGGVAEPLDKYKDKDVVKCPKCGNTHLLFGEGQEEEFKCPKCEKGKFIVDMIIMS